MACFKPGERLCPVCGGDGLDVFGRQCGSCYGTGRCYGNVELV